MSVLNEPGPAVGAREWKAFTRLVESRLHPTQALLCSVSLPPGVPGDCYADLVRRARHGRLPLSSAQQGPRGPCGWVPAPRVAMRSPIGAGDAFSCGLSLRLKTGAALDNAVAYAVAVAAAQLELRTGEPGVRGVEEFATWPHAAASGTGARDVA